MAITPTRPGWRRPPTLRDPDPQEERHPSWLELFFDLCFVAAVAALAADLHHDPTWGGDRPLLRPVRPGLVGVDGLHLVRLGVRQRRRRVPRLVVRRDGPGDRDGRRRGHDLDRRIGRVRGRLRGAAAAAGRPVRACPPPRRGLARLRRPLRRRRRAGRRHLAGLARPCPSRPATCSGPPAWWC